MVLFAIPLIGMKNFGVRAPLFLRIACFSGFLVSFVYIGFTIVPIISVESRLVFAIKIIVVVVLANGLGFAIYMLGNRRHSLKSEVSEFKS
jgi:hypothetical protein